MKEKDRFLEEEVVTSYEIDKTQTAFGTLMRKVYVWMALALTVTGLTSLYVATNESIMYSLFQHNGIVWGLFIAELVIVFALSGAIHKMSFMTAGILFVLYSVINGVAFSFIFLAYTMESITSTFLVTAGTFAAMSMVGYFIKKDLSALGKILIMSLIGLIIASIVNIFLQNSTLMWVVSYAGVLIFVGLTAYDTQKIKKMFFEYGAELNEETQKLALLGSLTLYLDFINLFIYLLRIFGDRRG